MPKPQPGDLDPTSGKFLVDPLCICKRPHPCPIHWPDETRPVQLSLLSPTGRAIRKFPR